MPPYPATGMTGKGVLLGTVDPGLAQTEFSLVRFKGDTARAQKVYDGTQPLTAEDVAAGRAIFSLRDRPDAQVRIVEINPAGENFADSRKLAPTLVIGAPQVYAEIDALEEFLRTEHVSSAQFTPSMLQSLRAGALPELATIVSAGESLTAELVGRWAPGRRLFNAYGPTEAAIGA